MPYSNTSSPEGGISLTGTGVNRDVKKMERAMAPTSSQCHVNPMDFPVEAMGNPSREFVEAYVALATSYQEALREMNQVNGQVEQVLSAFQESQVTAMGETPLNTPSKDMYSTPIKDVFTPAKDAYLTPATASSTFGTSPGPESGGPSISINRERAPRRRHGRMDTPDHERMDAILAGQSLYRLEPQNDRGLLNDFFTQVHQWAKVWTYKGGLPQAKMAELAAHPAIEQFLGGTHNLHERVVFLANDDLRCAIVGAVVVKAILNDCVADGFMKRSDPTHPMTSNVEELSAEWGLTLNSDVEGSLAIIESERHFYTCIKMDPAHRDWRAHAAETRAASLISWLAPFLFNEPQAIMLDTLTEYYVKGYRIGFRMRMVGDGRLAMHWPMSGDDYNPAAMVNTSIHLLGFADKTIKRTRDSPGEFEIKFAMSPTVIKFVPRDGAMRQLPLHSAMVHLKQKERFTATHGRRGVGKSAYNNGNDNGYCFGSGKGKGKASL